MYWGTGAPGDIIIKYTSHTTATKCQLSVSILILLYIEPLNTVDHYTEVEAGSGTGNVNVIESLNRIIAVRMN